MSKSEKHVVDDNSIEPSYWDDFKHYDTYRIGPYEVKDVWVSSKGVVGRKEKKIRVRGHWSDTIQNDIVSEILWIVERFLRKRIDPRKIDPSVLVDVLVEAVECSREEALDYAIFLPVLFWMMR